VKIVIVVVIFKAHTCRGIILLRKKILGPVQEVEEIFFVHQAPLMTIVATDDVVNTLVLESVIKLTTATFLYLPVVFCHLLRVVVASITEVVGIIQTATVNVVAKFLSENCLNLWCHNDLLRFDGCILPD